MPYRTPQERHDEDTATLRGPDGGLDEGEWITYWTNLPHSVMARMTSEATVATIDPMQGRQMTAQFDAGIATLARLRLGIVDWLLFGPDHTVVPWDPANGAALIEGLPDDTYAALLDVIGAGNRTNLDEPVDPDVPDGETLGNGSGGFSSLSSTVPSR